MRENDFLEQFLQLLHASVLGVSLEQKINFVQTLSEKVRENPAQPSCRIIPFVTGRRPLDEAAHPGLGSSDNTSMICAFPDLETNRTYVLYELSGLEMIRPDECDDYALDVTLSFSGTDNSQHTFPIPGWDKRPVEFKILENDANGKPKVRQVSLRDLAGRNLVLALSPEKDFLPLEWQWDQVDPQIIQAATDFSDPFTFGHMFTQMLHVSLRLVHRGVPVSVSHSMVDVCDTRRFGSLYQRVLDRLVKPDTEGQAKKAGVNGLHYSFHPWFPVLLIGSDKAALYTDALVEDIVHKKHNLTDPKWLMRVGLYLEFLTCIGIFEAVKADTGDLLTPAERAAYETSPFFAEIRNRLNPKAWKEVWDMRRIVLPKFGTPQTGPVSVLNLLQKKKATLAFLQVHHEDLKHAIELAGRNDYNAQETWHRVFRDAERAVLRKTPDAFPELSYLDAIVKNFILWHKKGKNIVTGNRFKQIISLMGDQDGLFASACNQYRASMNEVAEWAKHHNLMDYTGEECVPVQVSLLEAFTEKRTDQVERLQDRDGYTGSLEVIVKVSGEDGDSSGESYELLATVPIFQILTAEERGQLAATMRRIELGPMERIIIQGRTGSSLFLVGEGNLQVLVRQKDGVDRLVGTKLRGEVIGETSLLTGAPRTATVRAADDGAVVYEIGKKQYEPIIKARPELVNQLAALMEENLRMIKVQREMHMDEKESVALSKRIHRFFFSD